MSAQAGVFRAHMRGTEIYRSIQAYWHINSLLGDNDALKGYIQSHKRAKIVKWVDGGILLENGTVVELSESDDLNRMNTPSHLSKMKSQII
jgi:hypothetical protein